VLVKSLNPPCDEGVDFEHNVGTLRVVEYPISKQRFLEWTQCELIVETEDQEWTLVQQKKIRGNFAVDEFFLREARNQKP